jgi:hypothetical protein
MTRFPTQTPPRKTFRFAADFSTLPQGEGSVQKTSISLSVGRIA